MMNGQKALRAVVSVGLMVLWAGVCPAEAPRTMAFQGRMTDSNSQPLQGNFSVSFRIYDSITGGTRLWEETQNLDLTGGLFSTILGSRTPLSLPFDRPYWIEIQVGTDLLTPRQPLAASPYAFRAQRVEGIEVVNGNVGIGTANPAGRLDVAGVTITDYLQVDPQDASLEGGEIQMRGAGGNPAWLIDVYADRYRLHSGGREKFAVTQAGDVGIGTATPVSKLDVEGNAEFGTGTSNLELVQNGQTFEIRHHDPGVAWRNISLNAHGGNVGIGTINPGNYRLYVNGAAYATGGWIQGSSVELKTELRRLGPQQEEALLAKLAHLPLYRYRLKQADRMKAVHLGILAEEAPAELVDDDHRAISYGDYLATLLAAVKAQQRRIEALESEVARLKRDQADWLR